MSRRCLPWVLLTGLALAPTLARPAGPPRPRTDLYGDPLPPGAVARLGTVRFRKVLGMNGLTFSPDGRLLASTGWTCLFLWEPSTGRLIRTLEEKQRPETPFSSFASFHCYAFSPDGRRVVSADSLGEWLYTWDVATGRLLRRHKGPGEAVSRLALSPDGKAVAVGCLGGAVGLWGLNGGKRWRTVPAAEHLVDALAFTADGKRLACLVRQRETYRTSLLELEAATGRVRRRFALGEVEPVLSPDARAAATYDEKRGLRLWDVAGGKSRRLLRPAEGDFSELTFSPDGRTLLATDYEKQEVQFWDVATGRRLRRVRLSGLSLGEKVLLSPDGKTLFCADSQNAVRRWDARTGRPLPAPAGHVEPPEQLAFSADGRILTSLSTEAGLELYRWETATGRVLSPAIPEGKDLGESGHWRLSPGGRWVAGARGPTVRLFDTRTGKRVRELKGHTADVSFLVFSGDGKVLAAAGEDRVVRLWDAGSGKLLRSLDARKAGKRLNALVLSRDGSVVAVGGAPLRLHLWGAKGRHPRTLRGDPKGWEEEEVGEEDGGWCEGRFSPDARTLYVLVRGRVQVWDLAGRREGAPFGTPYEVATYDVESDAVAVSPDGRLLARVDQTLRLDLWETASGRVVYSFDGHWSSVAFSPDGRTLATGSAEDGSVLLWDVHQLFRAQSPPGARRPPPEALWQRLADPDAGKAYRALVQLADDPAAAGFLARRLEPVRRADPAVLAALVRDLGSADYATRQKAESALAAMGDAARPALAEAHKKGATLEARLRAGRLLRRLDARAGEPLREARAVQALEQLGTAAARRLLRDLAGGIPEARLTREAKSALGRLDRARARAR